MTNEELLKLKLQKAQEALQRVHDYLAKQKIHKVPATAELVSTLQFVIKTQKHIGF